MTQEERVAAERAVIGSILIDGERCMPLAVNAGVADDWFTVERLSLAWHAMRLLFTEGVAIDAITVLERATRCKNEPRSPFGATEFQIADVEAIVNEVPTTAHFEYYLELCRLETMFRRVEKAHRKFGDTVLQGQDVAFATQQFSAQIAGILGGIMGTKVISVADVANEIEQSYLTAREKRLSDLNYTPGLPIPFKPMNFASQGVQEGLTYIGARPSVGKTAFILNLVRAWCESGVKVAFNSLDMAIKPMLKRPIGEISRVSFAKASFGTTTKADMDAIHEAIHGVTDGLGTVEKKGLVHWPLSLLVERDVDVFRSWCVAMRAAGKLDVAIVDFVQLMTTHKRYANDNEKLEYVSGVLKSIALDLDIPVIALSQLNRACEEDGGRVPTASDLRGSGALEQDATAVWILHNDRDVWKKWFEKVEGRYVNMPVGLTMNATPDEFRGITPVRVIIAKNQNGQAGADIWFPFVFFKKYCLFMLGDYEARCPQYITGSGWNAKPVTDYAPMYAKVMHDFRNDPFEAVLRRHGCLVGGDFTQEGLSI